MIDESEERFIEPLSSLYEVHLSQLFLWEQTLVYGVFALTFAFYLALFRYDQLRQAISGLSSRKYMWAMVLVFVGNAGWAWFCFSVARGIISTTNHMEEKFGQQLPGIISAGGLDSLYEWGPALLVIINWFIWALLVSFFTRSKHDQARDT